MQKVRGSSPRRSTIPLKRRFQLARGTALAMLVVAAVTSISGAPADAATSGMTLRTILRGYDRPVHVATRPDARRDLFIVEQAGVVRRATSRDGRWRKRGAFLDLRSVVLDPETNHFEQGLLGLAFHPDHARNRRLYVAYIASWRTVEPRRPRRRRVPADLGSCRGPSVRPDRPRRRQGRAVAQRREPRLRPGWLPLHRDRRRRVPRRPERGRAGPALAARQDPPHRPARPGRLGAPPVPHPERESVRRSGRARRDLVAWASQPVGLLVRSADGRPGIGDPGEARREEVDLARAGADGRQAGKGANFGWDDCEGTLEFEADEGDADELCGRHVLPVVRLRPRPGRVLGHRRPGASGSRRGRLARACTWPVTTVVACSRWARPAASGSPW